VSVKEKRISKDKLIKMNLNPAILYLESLSKGMKLISPPINKVNIMLLTIGPSRAGKSAFINAVYRAFGSSSIIAKESPDTQNRENTGTKYLTAYDFINTPVGSEFKHPLKILDTRGTVFNVQDQNSIQLLDKIISGLPLGTDMSNSEEVAAAGNDPSFKPNYVLITYNVLEMVLPDYVPGVVSSWFYPHTFKLNPIILQGLKLLYDHLQGKMKTDRVVKFLITHMDKTDITQDQIRYEFSAINVPPIDVFFAAKNKDCHCLFPCTHWTPKTLKQYRNLFSGLQNYLDNLPKQ
jgi:hypothetical protein